MSDVDADVLLARAYLSRVAEPASLALWSFVARVGPVDAVTAIRTGRADADAQAACEARRSSVDPEADLLAAEQCGLRLVVPESRDWPHFALGALERSALRCSEQRTRRQSDDGDPVPPLALWVKGTADLASVGVRSVGIVGARAATPYGERVTADLAYGLAGRDVVVVSGGAFGIDAAAHRAALAGGGQTVLVSAGGLDRPYPPGNATVYDRAAENGVLIAESPPGSAPHRHRFLTRNRLIAALSTGTVVVEAARRSGALNTAKHCFAIGRPIMAVPGPVTSAMSAGCHDLLRRDPPALLVTSVDDVLDVVGGVGESPVRPSDAPDVRQSAIDSLDPVARRVLDGLRARGRARPDEIAIRCGVSTVEVIRALPALDLAGLLDTADAGYRLSRPAR